MVIMERDLRHPFGVVAGSGNENVFFFFLFFGASGPSRARGDA